MSETANCPKCGKILPQDAPAGLCPSCLLAAALTPGDSKPDRFHSPTTPGPGRFIPPTVEDLAPLFPSLEILELVGYGGMGAVYKARQKKLGRLVALKIIRPEVQSDPAFAERFNREARTLARLSHPGIVAIHDFGDITPSEANGTPDAFGTAQPLYYFVMEFVDGVNLRQMLNNGRMPPEKALAIVPQVCEALQYAHDEGVVHRDIKPENILIDARGRIKIADFGLAKIVSGPAEEWTLTGTHQVMGTPRYMAPEQMEGSHGVDHRADIYSLGVVFYEMLTGQVPAGHFEPPSRKSNASPALDSVVLRAMARDPERRFQQASELRQNVVRLTEAGETHNTTWQEDDVSQESGDGHASENHSFAFSAILSREAMAAARWIGGQSENQRKPVFAPRWFMLLLTVIPCVMLFFQWFDIYVTDAEATRGLEKQLLVEYRSLPALHIAIMPLQLATGTASAVMLCLLAILQVLSLGQRQASKLVAGLGMFVAGVALLFLILHRFELYHWIVAVFADPVTGAMPRNHLSFGRPPGVGDSYVGPLHHELVYRVPFLVTCGSLFLMLICLASELRHAKPQKKSSFRPEPVEPVTRKMGTLMIVAASLVVLSGIVTGVWIVDAGSSVDPFLWFFAPLQLFCLPVSVMGLIAGFSLRNNHQTPVVKVASILLLIPITPAWLLAMPIGAWCLATAKFTSAPPRIRQEVTVESRGAFWITTGSVVLIVWFFACIAASFLMTATVTSSLDPGTMKTPSKEFTLVLLLQLLNLPVGIMGLVAGGNLRQGRVTTLVSIVEVLFLLPYTPAFLVTAPIGLWCLTNLKRSTDASADNPQRAGQSGKVLKTLAVILVGLCLVIPGAVVFLLALRPQNTNMVRDSHELNKQPDSVQFTTKAISPDSSYTESPLRSRAISPRNFPSPVSNEKAE